MRSAKRKARGNCILRTKHLRIGSSNASAETKPQKRLAIKQYWRKISDDLKNKPKEFFRTFRPFLTDKDKKSDTEINLKVDGNMIKNQGKVSEILADHFATIADGIGGADAELVDENDFIDHPRVQLIAEHVKNSPEAFDFEAVNETQVRTLLESLDVKKATGGDGIPARVLKIRKKKKEVLKKWSCLFAPFSIRALKRVHGPVAGRGEIGLQCLKKETDRHKRTIGPLRYYLA